MDQNFTDIPQPKGETSQPAPEDKLGSMLDSSLRFAPVMPSFGSKKRKRQRRITKILVIIAFILAIIGMGFAVAGIITGDRTGYDATRPAADSQVQVVELS